MKARNCRGSNPSANPTNNFNNTAEWVGSWRDGCFVHSYHKCLWSINSKRVTIFSGKSRVGSCRPKGQRRHWKGLL